LALEFSQSLFGILEFGFPPSSRNCADIDAFGEFEYRWIDAGEIGVAPQQFGANGMSNFVQFANFGFRVRRRSLAIDETPDA